MKAAIITANGKTPICGDFKEPVGSEGLELISVSASALSNFSKSRSVGKHYSSTNLFPCVAGADGVGRTSQGQRVYFVLPEAPFGALAEKALVERNQCIPIPDEVDDVTAAAIANPGMSAWAALVERAHLQRGETVLINGATGSAGRLAIQIAKYLGAGKVIALGRMKGDEEQLKRLGADVVIPFNLGADFPNGASELEEKAMRELGSGIDVVVDYLWGESARTVVVAIAKAAHDAKPVRFVHVGGASGEESIDLPGAALRSSAIQLMGSGIKSVSMPKLLGCIQSVFSAVKPATLQIVTKTMQLSAIEDAWNGSGTPRIVIKI